MHEDEQTSGYRDEKANYEESRSTARGVLIGLLIGVVLWIGLVILLISLVNPG